MRRSMMAILLAGAVSLSACATDSRQAGDIAQGAAIGAAGGAAVGAVAVGTEIAQAQDDLGANIANTVTNAVSSVATNSSSGGTLIGGVSTESNSVDLGEQTGTAIADASGGNNNVSFVS